MGTAWQEASRPVVNPNRNAIQHSIYPGREFDVLCQLQGVSIVCIASLKVKEAVDFALLSRKTVRFTEK